MKERNKKLIDELDLRYSPHDNEIYEVFCNEFYRSYFIKNWPKFVNDFASFTRLVEENYIMLSKRTLEVINNFIVETELGNIQLPEKSVNYLNSFFTRFVNEIIEHGPEYDEAKTNFAITVAKSTLRNSTSNKWQNHISNDNKVSYKSLVKSSYSNHANERSY